MSQTDRQDEQDGGVPSNTELAERTARMEQKIDGLTETVNRIEESVTDEQNDLAADLEQNSKRTRKMWAVYRIGKYTIPTGATVLGGLAALGLI